MTRFIVKINEPALPVFRPFLYNEPAHLHLQPSENFYVFYLIHPQDNLCHARLHLFIENGVALSSYCAPFGSLEFTAQLPIEEIEEILETAENFCIQKNITALTITSYPFCYAAENSAMLANVLVRRGYLLQAADLNFHLAPLSENFVDRLHVSARRRLKKCQDSNYVFACESREKLSEVYDLYIRSRGYKNLPVKMQLEKLESYFHLFPENYFLFTVRDKERLIASCIAVKPGDGIMYNFLPADDPEYRNSSPMIFLIDGMFAYCKDHGYPLLDLGTASLDGVPLRSLVRFKQNLGGIVSLKPTYKKSLLL